MPAKINFSFLFLLFSLVLLVGCGNRPTISDAQNAIKIEKELAKIEVAKSSLATMRDSVGYMEAVKEFPAEPEPLHMFSLKEFLNNNDCYMYFDTGQLSNAKECYRLTVVRLIKETYYADVLTDKAYKLEVSNFQYNQTVNAMFDVLGIPAQQSKP